MAVDLQDVAAAFDVPGAALGVFDGQSYTETACGLAHRGTGVEATTDTLWQIGSITKPYTAALTVGVVDDLGTPLRALVPESELDEAITVRHLLNHTSGLPADWFPDTGRGDDCLDRLLPLLTGLPLTHPVGAMVSYSNAAFSLAGLVVERLTGDTWDEALRTRLLEPLGLEHSVTLAEQAILHRVAVGHLGTGGEQRPAPIWHLPRASGPAGGIACTVADVVGFGRAFLAASSALPTALTAALTTPTITWPADNEDGAAIGLGWGLRTVAGHRLLAHDGGTIGQSAALRVFPDLGVVVALCTNGGSYADFRDAVLAEVLPSVGAPAMPAGPEPSGIPHDLDLDRYVGSYRRVGTTIDVARREGGLAADVQLSDDLEALATGARQPLPMVAVGIDRFLVDTTPDGPRRGWAAADFLDVAGETYLHLGGRAARRADR
jgi:CubicO group peptidase (beta-lactamase class C family)